MARKHNNTGRSTGGERHIRLPLYLLQSAAWRSLSCAASRALVEATAFYKGDNNGYLGLGVRLMAERMNCSKDTASRALIELEDRGLIACMHFGTFNTKRRASEYRLTWLHCDRGGQKPTNDFMQYGKRAPAIQHSPHYRTA